MNILMGTSITTKYENCVEVSIQDMFDLANNNALKDLTLKCKNEADKTKRRSINEETGLPRRLQLRIRIRQ